MSDSWYLTRTVSRIRPEQTGTDRYGEPIYADGAPVEIDGCSWDPKAPNPEELGDPRTAVVSGLLLYCADPAVDIEPTDSIEVEGVRYDVDGEVGRFTGSRLGNDHAVVALRRVEG